MATTKTGTVHGKTIELESTVPELDGKRVRVVLEAVDEQRLTTEQQSELWKAWVARGPQGPIDDDACTTRWSSSAGVRTDSGTSRTTGCGSEHSADRSLSSESLTQNADSPPHLEKSPKSPAAFRRSLICKLAETHGNRTHQAAARAELHRF